MAGNTLTHPKARTLRFVTTVGGCFVCISHKLNADGYFRKRWSNGFEMFHRFIYRAHKGPIPDDHEIDHMCGNRACCNPDHLQALPEQEHAVLTNETRYRPRKDAAKAFWLETRCTGTALADKFGVTFGAGCGWIREGKLSAIAY